MDDYRIKDSVADLLDSYGYYLQLDTHKNGVPELIDKCAEYVKAHPEAKEEEVIDYADSLVTPVQFQIIWSAPDPYIPIRNFFNDWLPDKCVMASFIGAYGYTFYTWDDDTPSWDHLPKATWDMYKGVSSEVVSEIRQAEENRGGEIRCLVLKYKTLK